MCRSIKASKKVLPLRQKGKGALKHTVALLWGWMKEMDAAWSISRDAARP